jgi:PAS domain-containing protein
LVSEYIVFALLAFSAVTTLSGSYYAYQRRNIPGGLFLALVLAAMAVWALTYAGELLAEDLTVKVLWARFKYTAALTIPPLWVACTLSYTGRQRWLGRRNAVFLAAAPFLAVALTWTNEAHGLVWLYTAPTSEPLGTMILAPALGFWAIAAVSYAMLAFGTSLLVLKLTGRQTIYSKQSAILVSAALIPWAANALSPLQLTPLLGLDLAPLTFPLCAAALWLGFKRFDLLKISPAAGEEILENLTDGIIALDADNCVRSMNAAAEQILGVRAQETIGEPLAKLTSERGRFIEGRSLATLMRRYNEIGRATIELRQGWRHGIAFGR